MNVNELIEWLESAKRVASVDISEFTVIIPKSASTYGQLEEALVDIEKEVIELYD